MKTFNGASFVRVWFPTTCLAALIAGCGNPAPTIVSSTLQEPAKPGDGYGLVKTTDDRHVILHLETAENTLFFEIPWQGVYAMPKYGGDIATIDRDTKADFMGLAVSGDQIVWLKGDSNEISGSLLWRRPAEGGPSTLLRHGKLIPVGYDSLEMLTADSSHAYFFSETFIDVTPVAGGPAEQVPLPNPQTRLNPGPGIGTVAGDYPLVYFTSCSAGYTDCVLLRADVPAGTSQVIASVSGNTQIVGLDADAVYLLDDDQRLWSIARADGTATDLITPEMGLHPGTPAVVDSQSVYFFGTEPGVPLPAMRLMSVPKEGGPPAIIGSDERIHQWVPWDVAVDDQFVFVLTSQMTYDGGNEILAFPKTLPPSP